jgi:phosphoglycerate kinase
MSSAPLLTIDDLALDGKTVFVRADLNTPVDPASGKLLELSRIQEAAVTLRDLSRASVVLGSHQGRVGRDDFIPLAQHAEGLSKSVGRSVQAIEDICGPAARAAIRDLRPGDILLLDNLRFSAEENGEFAPEQAVRTMLVQRLAPLLNACVLDAFPTAHRAHPSIVGFAHLLPACGGRVVIRELKALNRVLSVAKGPYTTVLGGAKISDRLEAIDTLIANRRADKVLLSGLIANVFLRASGKIGHPLGIEGEEKYVGKAKALMVNYPDTFELPIDVAIARNGERAELLLDALDTTANVLDIGSKTIDHYSRLIRSSGTVFMSGPPGAFEHPGFGVGTEALLRAMASSFGTTIVSGGHLTAALHRFGIKEWIDVVSTAGGALVLYLAGKRLPLIEALERAAQRGAR